VSIQTWCVCRSAVLFLWMWAAIVAVSFGARCCWERSVLAVVRSLTPLRALSCRRRCQASSLWCGLSGLVSRVLGADSGGLAAECLPGLRYQVLAPRWKRSWPLWRSQLLGIAAVHIEGMPGRGGADRDAVDYEVSDASGRVMKRSRSKARDEKTMGASDAFRALRRLVEDQDAGRYTLQVGVRAGGSSGPGGSA